MARGSGRDKHIMREIHRLFWEANFVFKRALWLSYLGRIPAVAAYNIFIPLVSALGIQAIVARDTALVERYAVWVVLLAVFYCISWSFAGVQVSKNAIRGSEYLQDKVLANFLSKDYDFYSNAYFGSLGAQATRIRDAFNSYGELVTLSIPKQATIVVVGVAVISWQSPLLALVTLATMVLVLSFTMVSSSWRLTYRRQVYEEGSKISGQIGDALSHATTVKSFASESMERKRLRTALKVWSHAQYKSWVSSLPADGGRMLLAAIATAALLVLSARMYAHGDISLAIVVLIQLYVVKLIAATMDIAEIIKRYEETMGAAYEPVKTMLVEPTITDPERPQSIKRAKTYRLALSDVTYQYPEAGKARSAVKNFSLDIEPGEKIGLVGYSGSGKTTLSKLLLRFMDVTEGAVTINGIDVRQLRQKDLRKIISYVPQEPLLFHRTIRENIAYGRPGAIEKEVLKVARLAYVHEFAKDLPHGYDTLVGERGVKLSGGQRQRVAIARALLKDAPVLVLDEATSALDSESEHLIQEALWRLMKDRTAVVIAHRLSTIRRMDRIVVMDKGKIVQMGSHEQLLKDKQGIYARLWAHQSDGYIASDQAALPSTGL
jgi:ATP-binding cassette subfamily B protein